MAALWGMKVLSELAGWGGIAFAAALTMSSADAHPGLQEIVDPWAVETPRADAPKELVGTKAALDERSAELAGSEPPAHAPSCAPGELSTDADAQGVEAGAAGTSDVVSGEVTSGVEIEPAESPTDEGCSCPEPPPCLQDEVEGAVGRLMTLTEVENPWRRVTSGLAVDRTWRDVPLLVDPWANASRVPFDVEELGLIVDPWAVPTDR